MENKQNNLSSNTDRTGEDESRDWPADALTEPGSPWGPYGILLRHVGSTTAIVEQDVTVFGHTVRKGFVTDGASMPGRLARFTTLLPAALKHDDNYDPHAEPGQLQVRTLTRSQADKAFCDDCFATFEWQDRHKTRTQRIAARAANWTRARHLWSWVRAFGWKPWNRGTERGILNVED